MAPGPPALKVWAPGHGPRQVFFAVEVKLLHGVDCVNQQFSASVVVNFQWMLSGEEKERWEKDKAAFKADWQPPAVEVPTAVEMAVERQPVTVGLLGNMLVGKCSQLLKGTFLEVMELESFPFDCQEFKLTLVFPESDEVFQMHPSAEDPVFVRMAQDRRLLAEFRFTDPVVELGHMATKQLREDFSVAEVRQPTVVLRLKASRAWQSHAYKIILTLALLSMAVMFAFMLPHSELGDRLSHTTTLLLTAVAFQLVVSSSLPQLDYLTTLDKYILVVNVYILLVMFSMTVVFWCTERECLESGPLAKLDFHAMVASGLLWLGCHAWLFLQAALALWGKERNKLAEFGAFRGQRAGAAAALSTSSHFAMLDSGAQVFFGNQQAYRVASKVVEDHTHWTGTWYSEDFYPGHGIEYVFISVICDEAGVLQLQARKITGDENVPCGKVTWQTIEGVPTMGGGPAKAKVQVRGDTLNKDGFTWWTGYEVKAVTLDSLTMGSGGRVSGTFKRQGGRAGAGADDGGDPASPRTERDPLL